MITSTDITLVPQATSGFGINTWNALDTERHEKAPKQIGEMIEADWQISNHITVVYDKQLVILSYWWNIRNEIQHHLP